MKSLRFPVSIIAVITFFYSCEIEVPPRYFDVNGQRNKLNIGYAEDWGPSDDLQYREWGISLRSEENMPGSYITFLLESYDNVAEISEGTYEYDYLGGEGTFSYISIGYDIEYDYKGYPSGNLLSDDFAEFSGHMSVDRSGSNYYFNFDMEVFYQNEVYTITGEYEGGLIIDGGFVDLESY